jgi:NAD(P)-dependent dehydrogenase (short-subunit alcohol dehydrogenase family)
MTNASDLPSTAALVTGASRGLGLALSIALAQRGTRVAMVAREARALHAAVAELRERGLPVHALPGDVADKSTTHALAGAAAGLLGEIDLVVHNASTLGPTPLRLLLDTECEDLAAVLETNLVGPFRLTRALAGAMALRGRGTIVHISSDAAVEAYPSWGAYSIAKAGQDHLSRILAAELAGTGVRVLAVDPGEMDTAMHAAAIPDADRSTLASPAQVALRIVAMLESAAWPSGARLLASSWEPAS